MEQGTGDLIAKDDTVELVFKEYAPDGALIKDTGEKIFTIPLSHTIKGFSLGLEGARVNERRKIYIHPEYGFGTHGRQDSNQLLTYEVVLVGKKESAVQKEIAQPLPPML